MLNKIIITLVFLTISTEASNWYGKITFIDSQISSIKKDLIIVDEILNFHTNERVLFSMRVTKKSKVNQLNKLIYVKENLYRK